MKIEQIIQNECVIEYYNAGGPGGQHGNKTLSAVKIIHKPTGISVTASERRSQHQNRKKAEYRLLAKLEEYYKEDEERIDTKIPKYSNEERLKDKKIHSIKKENRRNIDEEN